VRFLLLGGVRERAGDAYLSSARSCFNLPTFQQPTPGPSSGRTPLESDCGFYVHAVFYCIRWLSQAISGHGAYISQVNRLIFVNNSFILAKGRCQPACPAGGVWDFRPFDRREIDQENRRKRWVFALLFPVTAGSRCARKATISGFLARKSRFTRPKTPISETGSLLTLPSSGESVSQRELACRGREAGLFARMCRPCQATVSGKTGIAGRHGTLGAYVSAGPNFSIAVPAMDPS